MPPTAATTTSVPRPNSAIPNLMPRIARKTRIAGRIIVPAAAFANGVGDDLHLDSTTWAIFDRGSVGGDSAHRRMIGIAVPSDPALKGGGVAPAGGGGP